HRVEIRRRARAARRRGGRALRGHGRCRPHDRDGRQHVPDRRAVLRRAAVHGRRACDRGSPQPVRTPLRVVAAEGGGGDVRVIPAIPGRAAESRARFYADHERAILGTAVVMLFLVFWEGLERGWWTDALRPLIGAAAERWTVKPIFISSPTRIAGAAWRMFFVTGEIWSDLAWSALAYALGLGLAVAVGIP